MNVTTIEKNIRKMNQKSEPKRSYSCKEVQEILDVTRQSVYRLIKKKEFKATLVDSGYRIDKLSFDEWLDGRD